jgi:hypothetical protein
MVSSLLVAVLTSSAMGGDGAVTHTHAEQPGSLLNMNGKCYDTGLADCCTNWNCVTQTITNTYQHQVQPH